MMKVTMAAVVALTLPMMANAADINAAGHHYQATVGKVSLKSSGTCYGMKFRGNGKADPTLPTEINVRIGASDQAGGTYDWADALLGAGSNFTPAQDVLVGDIQARTKNKLTLGFTDLVDQKRAATALLEYAGQNGQFFGILLANASVVSYTVSMNLTKDGAKIKEVAVVNSFEGACTATARVTRQWKATHIVP